MFGGGLAARFGGFRVFLIGTVCLVTGIVGTALAGYPLLWSVLVGVLGSIHPGVIMAVGTLSARPENRAVGMAIFYFDLLRWQHGGQHCAAAAADLYGGPAGGLLAAAVLSAAGGPMFMPAIVGLPSMKPCWFGHDTPTGSSKRAAN